MLTYRKFRSDEGVENAKSLKDAAKPVCLFDERLIQLQKEFIKELWQHKNPYTNLRYCDDPVFVMTEIVNECDLFTKHFFPLPAPYDQEFTELFARWLELHSSDKKATDFDLADFEDETVIQFKMDLQEKYFRTMYDYMRQCGVKIPITGTNWGSIPANMKSHHDMDFYDGHSYHYDWRWGEFEKRCANDAITNSSMYRVGTGKSGEAVPASYLIGCSTVCCYATGKDKPTFISEWDMPWPNAYRAESPIYSAAVGMLQGWSGFCIHTYSYTTRLERMDVLGKEIASEKIGNTPYRQGIFSTWNDPAKFGLFYHAALITRRADVSPAKNTVSIKPLSKTRWDTAKGSALLEKTAIVSDFTFDAEVDAASYIREDTIHSDTGELLIDRQKHYGYVDTPMSKCVYGFLGKNGTVGVSDLNVTCETDFAVIAMSSLTDEPINASSNILLTTVGRAENTEAKFDGDQMLEIGKAPVLIEVIEAQIALKTDVDGLSVWAISPEGFYIGTVPTVYEDGILKFSVGKQSNSMYYLIVKE